MYKSILARGRKKPSIRLSLYPSEEAKDDKGAIAPKLSSIINEKVIFINT